MKKRVRYAAFAALLGIAVLSVCSCRTQDSASDTPVTSAPDVTSGTGDTSEETFNTTENGTPSSFVACSIATDEIKTFRYWLYTPSDPTENMPLIVYLHGGSGKGDEPELITAVEGFPKYLQTGQLGDVRAYVIIPQLPSDKKGWANAASALYRLIAVTSSELGIDRGNISLTGHSMGGTGAWTLALEYPQLFARIAPLSGSIRNSDENISKLKSLPVRAFVGSADKIVPPESSVEFIAALKAAGGNADITVFDGADHFSVPSLTYLDETLGLVDWLIGKDPQDG